MVLDLRRREPVDGVHPTAAPNSRPTPAVASIANTPQMVTLAAPTNMGAPPIRAATAPSDTRHKSETAHTAGTNAVAGASRIVSTGKRWEALAGSGGNSTPVLRLAARAPL